MPKIFPLHSFGDHGCPIVPPGPFRDNVRLFLQQAGELEDYTVSGNPVRRTLLIHGGDTNNLITPFYTLQENVSNSSHPFCDHCRCVGWSGHFVSKRTYHFIIPLDNRLHKPLGEGALDDEGHLLHGVIHSNGYGHLVCLNGIEGGSKVLSGREIMDLWDRICTSLRVRKMTVDDTSRKRSIDLRLLHGVAYEHTWFGRWGYRFCRGSFGITEENYSQAIKTLGSLELDEIVKDLSKKKYHKGIKQMVRCYRDMSESQIITIKDLLRFMLTVKPRAPMSKITVTSSSSAAAATSSSAFISRNSTQHPLSNRPIPMKKKSARYKKFSTAVGSMDSRWPKRRLEFAAQVIVDALKESGSGGMTRQDVRDAARLHIGDTGLLDYVLKSLNNVIVGNYVVRRMVNSSTRILEYTIHELGKKGFEAPELEEPKVIALVDPQVESSSAAAASSSALISRNSTKHPLPNRPIPKKKRSARYNKFSTAVASMDSRWPKRKLEFAAEVIVDALKESGSGGMTRQEVRDAARLHIGDTGLLDYVLKSLNNVIVGSYVVRRMKNSSTRILEYTIHELGKNRFKAPELEEPRVISLVDPQVESSSEPCNDVYSDVAYLYKNVVLGYPDSDPADLAVQTILDSRHFVKEWPLRDEMEQVLTFICRLKPNFVNKSELKGPPCGEIVVVPLHATVGDLKQAAEIALRDTYCIADRLIVTDIIEFMGMSDEEVLSGLVQSGMELCIRGISIDLCTPLKYQGGSDNWKVRCECGTQDDDGERMVACDTCEVWQHTRCCGIDDSETVPPLFVCSGCGDSIVPPRIDSDHDMDCVDGFLISTVPTHLVEYGYGY